MAEPETLSIPEIRARAAEMRRLADEMDSHVDALLALMQPSKPAHARPPHPAAKMVARVATPDARLQFFGGGTLDQARTHRHGIVTSKWMRVLQALATFAGRDPFPVSLAVDAVREGHGKTRRPTEIRRQFQPYVDAGYLIQENEDAYRFTDRGFAKIGITPVDEAAEAGKANENEAPTGDAGDASETALHAQAEGDHRNVDAFRRVAGVGVP